MYPVYQLLDKQLLDKQCFPEQPRACSRRTTERCKIPVWGVSRPVWRPYSYGLVDRRYDRNLIPNAKFGEFASRLRTVEYERALEIS